MKPQGQHGRYYAQGVHEMNANPVHTFGASAVQQNQSTLAGHNLQSLPPMAAAQQMQQSSVPQQQMGHNARNFMPHHSGQRQRHPPPALIQQRQPGNVMQHNATVNSQPGAMMPQGFYNQHHYVVQPQMLGIHHRQFAQQQPAPYMVYYPQGPPTQYIMAPFSTAPQINQPTQSVPVRTSAQISLGTQNAGGFVQMSQPSQQYIASTETPAQSTEPVAQFQPPPPTRAPLEKRERKGAVIADPTTGRVFTEQELQSKAPLQQPETKSDTHPPSDSSSLRNTPSASSDAALEFRDKVSSLALGTAGKDTTENHAPEVVTSEAEVEQLVTKSDTTDSEVVDGSCVCKPVSESDKVEATDINESNVSELNVVEAVVEEKTEISATNDTVAKVDDCAEPVETVNDEPVRTLPEVKTEAVTQTAVVEEISEPVPVASNGISVAVAAEENTPTSTTLPSASTAVTSKTNVEQNTSQDSKELIDAETHKTDEKTCVPLTKNETTPETVAVDTTENDELKVDSPPVVESKTVDNDSEPKSVSRQNSDGEKQVAKPKIDVQKVDFSSQLSKDELETKKGGKFEYRSDFLKSLQSAPESLRKPDTLPKLDIIHDVPVPQREPSERGAHRGGYSNVHQGMGADPFLPHYMTAQRSQGGRSNSQHNKRPSQHMDRPRKIISPSLTQDVKLHTVENAWKAQKTTDTTTEEAKTNELMKAFRGILNKLTPQKYQKLLEEVKKLTIDTEQRLQGILELIFDKAVDEPAFCLQYANLCKHLASNLKAVNASNDENGAGKELKFTPLLLTRCQKEFESKMYEGIDVEGKQAIIDETTDEEKKKLLIAELDEEKRKARKRSLGNIKLIGELYLLGMLKANIMMSCVERLLRDSEEESLECLCTLLRTIGLKLENDVKEFEQKKNLKRDSLLSPYFSALVGFVNEKKTSARVRFMIQDVLDMRDNGWKERKIQVENKPKTIDEIHSEAQEEEKKQQVQLQQHSQQKRQESMKKSGDYRGGNKNSKDVNMMLKNLKNTSTEHGNMQFGPGNFGAFWSQGARGGSQQKQESQMSSNRQMGNRPTSIQQRDSAKGPSRNASSHHSDIGRKGDSGFGSQEGEQWVRKPPGVRSAAPPPFGNDVIVRTRDNRDSRNSSMEKGSAPSSRGSSMKRESQKPVVEITHEELERRSMAAVKEYLGNNNTKDGIAEDIQSFCNDKNFHDFVTTAVNHALDVSSHQHQLAVGELLVHLFVQKLFSKEQFYLGLDEILQMADDIVVDVPKFFDYMGNILSPFYVNLDDSLRKQFFVTALKSCTANGCGAKLMSYVLKSACQSTPQNKVGSLWRSAGFNWCEFVSANENEQQFIEKNDLQFTVNPGSSDGDNQRLIDNKLIDREKFFANITRKVQTNPSNSNNEELLELIEKSFESSEDKTDPNFVSALVKAVVHGCVNSNKVNGELSYSFDQKRLETKCAILAKYCDNDEVRETKCLCALQQLAEELEHPSKLLNSIFTTLHDQNVISSEAFLAWEDADSTSQGKAVAVLSVKQFLTWLKEPEDYSDN